MTDTGKALAFSFGEPEAVLSGNMLDSVGLFLNPWGDYYEPPLDRKGLVKLLAANAHHGTIPHLRQHMLVKYYNAAKSPLLSQPDLWRAGFDLDVLGDCYFRVARNRFNQIVRLYHLPGVVMRATKQKDVFCRLQPGGKDPIFFKPGEVIQIKRYDPMQQIYGTVEYLGAINSVLLNESGTLFRRKYYDNGAHLGYIFYTADANFSEEDEKALKEQIRNSKGVGNFRSMFLNLPDGKKDSVQIIPVGDISQKDEFHRIKDISRNDILAAWRIQPALAGVMPENVSGFGDIEKINKVYFEYETEPRQQIFMELNQYLPKAKGIHFDKPDFALAS